MKTQQNPAGLREFSKIRFLLPCLLPGRSLLRTVSGPQLHRHDMVSQHSASWHVFIQQVGNERQMDWRTTEVRDQRTAALKDQRTRGPKGQKNKKNQKVLDDHEDYEDRQDQQEQS